ncbi:hypothetical protein PRIPAC_91769 [Pristionchus pacificus]|uniref:Uncharacterized protein n=1 Tax=Pristionchus pacificus TaxID=54126 RepID=A0A8R1Z492_PRIPA|nr:hypothetical protein PRIPAC_91769 [Pristionchus pacificus]
MEGPPSHPLPSYTSIDLEHELADIFATNLNPHIRDPDMSDFYSTRMGKSKKGIMKTPPTPIYPLPEEIPSWDNKSMTRSFFSSRTPFLLIALFFFTIPLLILFFFLLLSPSIHPII